MTGNEVRAVPWLPVGGGIALGVATLSADIWLVPDGPGSVLLWFALAGFVSAAAFVLDEPAAAAVDAAPVARPTRTGRRLLVGLVPAVSWLGGTAVAVRTEPALSWLALTVTGGGFLVMTVTAAAVLRRLGYDSPGEVVGAAAGAAVVLALVVSPPKIGTVLEAHDVSTRAAALWVILAAASGVVMSWAGSDPLTRWAPRARRDGG
jgi:hypothetical protein